jgi:DNA recombination protein RmuC
VPLEALVLDPLSAAVGGAVGLLLASLAAVVAGARRRARIAELEAELDAADRAADARMAAFAEAERRMADTFAALSAEALGASNRRFLDLAQETLARFHEAARGDLDRREASIASLVSPVREQLGRLDDQLRRLEETRAGAYEGLKAQVQGLAAAQADLNRHTRSLAQALRAPNVRGRWGEVQLRRVAELAGMLAHCDFVEQAAVDGPDGRRRPDMVVRLPGGKSVVVDAKTPLDGYLAALEADDDGRRAEALARHARQVRAHMKALGAKAYWAGFDDAPEFVVLFLPGESFFAAALEADPALIEAGMEDGVVLATPTTLIALLRAVAYGWRQERLAENARAIGALGAELHRRLGDLAGHLGRTGEQLGRAVESYNAAVGSLERRAMVSARRLAELAAVDGGAEPAAPAPIDAAPRMPEGAPEGAPASLDGGAGFPQMSPLHDAGPSAPTARTTA